MMLDFKALEARILEAAAAALTDSAAEVADRARQLAPIRKVFKGGKRRLRFKTMEEVEADRSLRMALGLGPETAAPPYIQKAFSPSSMKRQYPTVVTRGNTANMNVPRMRTLYPPYTAPGRLRSPIGTSRLNRWGKTELRMTGPNGRLRAEYKGSLGGRLRGEIHATPSEISGRKVTARVVSPTSYAKYQEFGTRHNPAHPFLRPAAEESHGLVAKNVRSSIGPALAAGIPGRGRVVIKYRLKAGG